MKTQGKQTDGEDLDWSWRGPNSRWRLARMKHLENFTAISGELKRHYRIKLNYPDRKLFSSPRRVTKWPIYTSKIKYILFTRVYTYHIFRGGHSRPLHFISHLSISCKQCSLCQCIYSWLADSLMVAFT